MQTYTDATENMLSTTIPLPPRTTKRKTSFVEANRKFRYTSREEFIRDAIRTQLHLEKEHSTFVEIPKEEYDKAQQAL
jgi:hypothetical protein